MAEGQFGKDFQEYAARLKFVTTHVKTCNQVGFVYDKVMLKHYTDSYYPERPDRIKRPFQKLEKSNVLNLLLSLDSRSATEKEILRIHTQEYAHVIEKANSLSSEERINFIKNIFICPYTYESALVSCGSTLVMVENIINKNINSGLALVRPPGHHAEVDKALGFCIFNNVAVAVKHAQNLNKNLRIMILDWDVHHGNGTQRMFYEDPSVLYLSLHRYDKGTFSPSYKYASHDLVGSGKGTGYNVNVAWNGGPMGDSEYILAFNKIVMPIAEEFGPDLILISAGFDAAKGDPLGGYRISSRTYGFMTQKLQKLQNVAIILEGGYNLDSISEGVVSCAQALLGVKLGDVKKFNSIGGLKHPKECAITCVLNTIQSHLPYWKCLKNSLENVLTLYDKVISINKEAEVLKQAIKSHFN